MNWEKFIGLIYKLEGGKLHFNKTEKDITSKAGIYKYAHPSCEIFKYYDEVAKSLNINKTSTEWSKEDLKIIDSKIDLAKDIEYSVIFYKDFFKKTIIDELNSMSYLYGSIYLNSPKLANRALQVASNEMIKKLNLVNKPLDTDGIIGNGSKQVIRDILLKCESNESLMDDYKSLLAEKCKEGYQDLVKKNEKNSIYLKGWLNRVDISYKFA